MDIGMHLLLFSLVSIGIVLMGAFFAHPEDGAALRGVPKRLLVFFVGCGLLAALMLLAEHTVASVS